MCLLQSSHLIITPACCSSLFQRFQFINCFLFFPLHFPLFTMPMYFVLFHLFWSFFFYFFIQFSSVLITLFLTYTSSFLSFLSTVSFFGHALFHSHLKNTKSRGSKHKSRRKSKKQKRPSSVCNSLT